MSDRFHPGPSDTTDGVPSSTDVDDSPTPDEDVRPGTEFGVAGQNAQAHEDAWGPAAEDIDELAFPDRSTSPDTQNTPAEHSDEEDIASTVRPASTAREEHTAWVWRLIWWALPLILMGATTIGYAAITGFKALSQGTALKLATGVLFLIGALGALAYLTTGPTTD